MDWTCVGLGDCFPIDLGVSRTKLGGMEYLVHYSYEFIDDDSRIGLDQYLFGDSKICFQKKMKLNPDE